MSYFVLITTNDSARRVQSTASVQSDGALVVDA